MSARVISREEAFANARRHLDAARARRDADRAAGRLPLDVEAICRHLERQQRATVPHRAAA
ncbi:hypothetical protein [Streptomyces montanisoli]|uniref:Uncharacterized protein n=1 Tax=Streptomyces montanisoli TaxID=2798581 RepID=A0A940RTL3_9ACTN|nr:hypothetical protein [Streptomyces montanisoli]MBP0456220.1 hypothetical protein [Streptomyces montanisoli]